MKFLKKLRARRAEDHAAIENSKALLEEAQRTDPHVDEQHRTALAQLIYATEQARRLQGMDDSNHYSESLTYAMRGNPA